MNVSNPIFLPIQNYMQHLAPLTQTDWDLFEAGLKIVHIKKKDYWFTENQIVNLIAYINKGSMRIMINKDGVEHTLHFGFADCFITDYYSFLNNVPTQRYFQALDDCELICFDKKTTEAGYDQSKNLERFGRKIAEFLFCSNVDITTALLTESPQERYEKIITLQPEMLNQVPQHMIASYLGITPVHLSRLRAKVGRKVS